MSKLYIEAGEDLTAPVGVARKASDGLYYKTGTNAQTWDAILTDDLLTGETGDGYVTGVIQIVVPVGVTYLLNDNVYIKVADGAFTDDASIGILIGVALNDAPAGSPLQLQIRPAQNFNVLTPAALTTNTNDYFPAGLAGVTMMNISSTGAVNLTGLATGAGGRTITLNNVGSFTITLKNGSASSLAKNRFSMGGDLSLTAGSSVTLSYNPGQNRWKQATGGSGGGGGLVSPLTNKGDIWGYSTTDDRIPAGANKKVIVYDSAQSLGVNYGYAGGVIVPVGADFVRNGIISPSNITSNQNDYSPTNAATASIWRLTGDSSFRYITGISASQVDGTIISLMNVGDNTLLLPHANTSSSAANRFHFQGYDQPLFPGQAINLIYDGTDSRWKLLQPQQVIPPARYGYYLRSEMIAQGSATGGSPIPNGSTFEGIWAVGVSSSGSVQATGTVTANHPGQVALRTNAGTAAQASFGLGNSIATSTVLFGGSTYWRWESQVLIGAVSTSSQRHTDRFGAFLLGATGGDGDGCYFRIVDNVNSGHLQLVARSGGVETVTNTSTDPTYASYDRYTITVNPAADIAEFFMNGTSLGTVTAHIPTATVAGCAWSIIKSVGSTSIAMAVDDVEIIMYQPTMA